MKPILCLDFDGVIHSYASGWKGARNIPDAPVPGALQFIVEALEHFDVHIFSSRSNYIFGRGAMKRWLRHHLLNQTEYFPNDPSWWDAQVMERGCMTMEPWHIVERDTADAIIKAIKWPTHKPPAMVTIDDRALTFTGKWPPLSEIKSFKPWNKPPAVPAQQHTPESQEGDA